jgi:hypothetical protein
MICCWVENPNPTSNELKQHLARIYDFFWLAEDGMKAQVFCHALHVSCITHFSYGGNFLNFC